MARRLKRAADDDDEAPAPSTAAEETIAMFPHDKISTWREKMTKDWLLEAPEEVFSLHSLATHLDKANPSHGFLDALGIELTGPFDVLSEASAQMVFPAHEYLHGRCYYDPPEVITVARLGSKSFGYFRDGPSDTPSYVVQGSIISGSFDVVGGSLAEVLLDLLEEATAPHPHHTLIRTFLTTQCGSSATAVLSPKTKRRKTSSPSLSTQHRANAQRRRTTEQVAPTLSGLGIVVPVHAKSRIGYRDLPVVDGALRKLLEAPNRGKAVDDLITRATIACDECDFGTALQLGLDLWTQGDKFEGEAVGLMESAYMMLRRRPFGVLARRHVQHRQMTSAAP